ncbi:AraC family transcriptional regulator [Paenibacillus sp. FSL R7-0273]|uniref:response regulator transcription factor n=1 Tax=Paenibacillus sp. FSL R7-0273 TaxID=1536772 RepID=UPI0004F7972B|nr:response regulator transcription factor [Paenibacillus sp. FSL R7-0273]AIQ48836.1 AraC family transcriptional regulator [Paenibacillus sp. FSL R7-0273]OMF91285.1 DNA-binding response regulator [Paenibacillus sp. FSL R7-0273]
MWKVAIIDDDFQVVRGLRKVIPWEELDAEFAGEAIDGESGLKLIHEVKPDIVLTDIYMPVMNGIQMIEQLKADDFTGRFVILSGYNDFEYARTALRLGVDDYLTKPVTVDQIRSVLSETIEKLEETYLRRLELGQVQSAERQELLCLEEWLAGELNGWSRDSAVAVPPELLPERKYTVLVLEVLWTERIRSVSLADWSLFKFAVSNIVTEVLNREWPAASFVWLFGNHAALLLPSAAEEADEGILQAAEQVGELMVDSMKVFLGLDFRFGTGNVKTGWNGIKASGDEAMQRLLTKLPLHLTNSKPQIKETTDTAVSEPPSTSAIQEKHRKAVQFMKEYIHKHYAEDITLETLASQLFISKNYLNQLFKKVTGETFTNYVIRVRIEKAKALLQSGNHLIYEVSEMVGYQNVPYFSTLFKKYCGVSPSELMKR